MSVRLALKQLSSRFLPQMTSFPMDGRVLYLGDTNLAGAAAYLAGLMTHWSWRFDYVPSDTAIEATRLEVPYSLFVLSDYPAALMREPVQSRLVEQVAAGAGLLMIGGWESFHGLGGDWDGTPVAGALPVEISDSDDRQNCDHPVLVVRRSEHASVAKLPWDARPPIIGGFNRFVSKSDATVVLEAQHFQVERCDDRFTFDPQDCDPLLVVGRHGAGRTAALATDVAPHWVGPLIDWGVERVSAQADGADVVEVGDDYARFLRQLLTWVRGEG